MKTPSPSKSLPQSVRTLTIALMLGCAAFSPLTHAGLFSKKPQVVVINEVGSAKGVFKDAVKGASLGSNKKIMLASFTVEFATEHNLQVSKKGFGSSNAITSTYYQKPDTAMLQAATDAAYAAFIEGAKADGFEIVEQAEMLANPAFKAVQEQSRAQAAERTAPGVRTISYAASALPIVGAGSFFLQSELATGDSDIPVLGQINMAKQVGSQINDGTIFNMSSEALKALASDSGIPVVTVRLTAGFADLSMSNSSRSDDMSVGTNSKFGLHFSKLNTNVMLHMPNEKARLVHNDKAMTMPAKIVASMEDESPTKRNVTLGLVNMALGGKSANKAVKYQVTLDGAVLKSSLSEASKALSGSLLDAIAR